MRRPVLHIALDTEKKDICTQISLLEGMLTRIFADNAWVNHSLIAPASPINLRQFAYLDDRCAGLSITRAQNVSLSRRAMQSLLSLPSHSLLVVTHGRVTIDDAGGSRLLSYGTMVILDNLKARTVTVDVARAASYIMVSLGILDGGVDHFVAAERRRVNLADTSHGRLLFHTVTEFARIGQLMAQASLPFLEQIECLCKMAVTEANYIDPVLVSGPLLAAATRLIEESGRDPDLTQEKAAAMLGISDRTLRRVMRKHDTSFALLLAKQRVNDARDMLGQSNLANEAIAHLVGYSNTATFYRQFATVMGETPAAFRDRHRSLFRAVG